MRRQKRLEHQVTAMSEAPYSTIKTDSGGSTSSVSTTPTSLRYIANGNLRQRGREPPLPERYEQLSHDSGVDAHDYDGLRGEEGHYEELQRKRSEKDR